MRKLLLLLAVFAFIESRAQLEDPITPGCRSYFVLDDDNDGYLTFDSDYFLNDYAIPLISGEIGYDLAANYQIALTAWSHEGFVSGTWTTVLPFQQTVEIQYTYVGPGAEYAPSVYYEGLGYNSCFIVNAVDPAADEDGDGISNKDEDANGDRILSNDDLDADGIADFNDSELGVFDELTDSTRIYPNPAQDVISISGMGETEQVSIFDLNGRRLMHVSGASQLDVSGFRSGVYLVVIMSPSGRTVSKIVKR